MTIVNHTTRKLACLEVDDDGALIVTGGMSGGGGASATKQDEQTALLTSINSPKSVRIAAAFTRGANVTPYVQNDVVAGVLEFTNAAPSGGYFTLMGATLRYNVSALPSGMSSFRLAFFGATPPSALADNAPFVLDSADDAVILDFCSLGAPSDEGGRLFSSNPFAGPRMLKLATGQTSLWAYLITDGGFTPAANGETGLVALTGFEGL